MSYDILKTTEGFKPLFRQRRLIDGCLSVFAPNDNILAGILVGSLADGTGDSVSDADVILFANDAINGYSSDLFVEYERGREIFYTLAGVDRENYACRKYILRDMSSIEIHLVHFDEGFPVHQPYVELFDKDNVIQPKLRDNTAPKHSQVYPYGDKGLIWELFRCIKWLSRGDYSQAKDYLKRLAKEL